MTQISFASVCRKLEAKNCFQRLLPNIFFSFLCLDKQFQFLNMVVLGLEFSLHFQTTPLTKLDRLSVKHLDLNEKIGKVVIK